MLSATQDSLLVDNRDIGTRKLVGHMREKVVEVIRAVRALAAAPNALVDKHVTHHHERNGLGCLLFAINRCEVDTLSGRSRRTARKHALRARTCSKTKRRQRSHCRGNKCTTRNQRSRRRALRGPIMHIHHAPPRITGLIPAQILCVLVYQRRAQKVIVKRNCACERGWRIACNQQVVIFAA